MTSLSVGRSRRTRWSFPLGSLVLVGSLLAGAALATPADDVAAASDLQRVRTELPDARPNIVLITTDDQTVADLEAMPRTRRLLGRNGITFTDAVSPHPLCCPARAEILTGQYAHNNGVRHNRGPYGGWQHLDSSSTVATWLQQAGYRTAFVGKYLHGYPSAGGQEPGWEVWNPTVRRVYGYYRYTMYEDGTPTRYPGVHNADLVGMKTADYIRDFAGDTPFFIWSSQVAPHSSCRTAETCWHPAVPARRHKDLFAGEKSPSLSAPSFNEDDVSDKSADLRDRSRVSRKHINAHHRARLQSLQAVDEAVRETVRALRATGELRNTVLLFTSDNGFVLGEHRFFGKDVPFEEALRVPMLARGPGIARGEVREQTVTLLDLAPTIASLAGVVPAHEVDGRDLTPLFADRAAPGWATVLVQAGTARTQELEYGWRYRGVRTGRYTYAEYPAERFVELYDRETDPFQLQNVAGDPRYAAVRADLDRRLDELSDCAGESCRRDFTPLPGVGDS